MTTDIRQVDYFYCTVADQPGEAHRLLARLADQGVNLLALTMVPTGPFRTQLTLFPSDQMDLLAAAEKAALVLDGPHAAMLVRGDDRLGALAEVHSKLSDAHVNVYASTGVADGQGRYGYVLYIRPDEFDRARTALGL